MSVATMAAQPWNSPPFPTTGTGGAFLGGNTPLAQSFSLSALPALPPAPVPMASFQNVPPLPPLLPPQQTAPCVYGQCFPAYKPFIRPASRVMPPLAAPGPKPPLLPQQAPVPPRQEAPPPPASPEKKSAAESNMEKSAEEKPGKGDFDASSISDLKKRLENPDPTVRSLATIDLLNILQRNPKLSEEKKTQPIVDAFLQKILSDPSELVRSGGELILQVGLNKHPSEDTLRILKALSQHEDGLTHENDDVASILQKAAHNFEDTENTPPAAPPKEKSITQKPEETSSAAAPTNSSAAAPTTKKLDVSSPPTPPSPPYTPAMTGSPLPQPGVGQRLDVQEGALP